MREERFHLEFRVVLGYGRIRVAVRREGREALVAMGQEEGSGAPAPAGAVDELAAQILGHRSLRGADPASIRGYWRRPP